MTNEELVEAIQSGNENLLPVLWEQVEKFISLQAGIRARQLNGYGGVSVEDLYQSGFLALVEAIQSYSPEKGMSFIGWLSFHLKNAFRAAAGYQTDAIHRAKSLDSPLQDDEDGTLADIIPDPSDQYEDAEKRLWLDQLRADLDKALATLPSEQSNTIERRYFQNQTLKQIAEQDGTPTSAVRQKEEQGLRKLRNPMISKELRQFVEERTPYYLRVGLARFNTTGTSSVEEIVFHREKWQ